MRFESRKGQLSLEYVISTLFFILLLAYILFSSTDYVSNIESDNERAQVNLEARRLTSMLLTSPGRHDYGSGGKNWAENDSTIHNVESIGFASDYHVLEKKKIMSLSTVGEDNLNYSQFRELTDVDNQYRFVFTVMPIVDTSSQFVRTSPPTNPEIIEPSNSNYTDAGNNVGYGSIRMGGTQYNVLTTAHDGKYDTMYMVNNSKNDWNFTGADRYHKGDKIVFGGREFEVEGFQNRGDERGTIVIFSNKLKTFGSAFDIDTTIIKLNRYAVLNQSGASLHPLKIEVYSWKG